MCNRIIITVEGVDCKTLNRYKSIKTAIENVFDVANLSSITVSDISDTCISFIAE